MSLDSVFMYFYDKLGALKVVGGISCAKNLLDCGVKFLRILVCAENIGIEIRSPSRSRRHKSCSVILVLHLRRLVTSSKWSRNNVKTAANAAPILFPVSKCPCRLIVFSTPLCKTLFTSMTVTMMDSGITLTVSRTSPAQDSTLVRNAGSCVFDKQRILSSFGIV